jgi:predicted nucleic acid-binding Zn ribbon protein
MALTAEEYFSLENTGLVDLFQRHRPMYRLMAQRAYDYAQTYVNDAGLQVRVDDVAVALEPPLHVNPQLRVHLAGKRLTQKYWYRRFGDLILDKLWDEVHGGAGSAGSAGSTG